MDAVKLLREHNPNAPIITTPWEELDGKQILEAMENKDTLKEELARLAAEQAAQDIHDHGPDCTCGCHDHEHEHPHDHDHEEHEHHHHDHDHEEHEHHHHHDHSHSHDEHEHHHHDHDHGPDCGCHDHDHHHHDADEVFISWGAETPRKYTEEEISGALAALADEEHYGIVLRAKGIVPCTDGTWIHFDYVPGEENVRRGAASITGRLCVIGAELKEHELGDLFYLNQN